MIRGSRSIVIRHGQDARACYRHGEKKSEKMKWYVFGKATLTFELIRGNLRYPFIHLMEKNCILSRSRLWTLDTKSYMYSDRMMISRRKLSPEEAGR